MAFFSEHFIDEIKQRVVFRNSRKAYLQQRKRTLLTFFVVYH